MPGLKSFTGEQGESDAQANVAAQGAPPLSSPRLPDSHADHWWAAGAKSPSVEGAETADGLGTDRVGLERVTTVGGQKLGPPTYYVVRCYGRKAEGFLFHEAGQ
jgi:hypothetical protein